MRNAAAMSVKVRDRMNARRRSGFVLVMTLLLIAISAVMLVGLSRQSLMLAMEAVEAQDSLQQRWAAVSFQEHLLKRAADLFGEQDRQFRESGVDGPSPWFIEGEISLGGQSFQLILGDEDAKVNLNTCYRRQDRQQLASMVRAISKHSSPSDVRLRPYRVSHGDENVLPAFDSWGQVFSLDLETGIPPTTLARITQEMTCWGSGRLNIVRASDKSLEQVCRMEVTGSTIQRIRELRRNMDSVRLDKLFSQLLLRESELEALREILADQSTCYSLWVHPQTNTFGTSSLHIAHFHDDGSTLLSFGM